MEERDVDQSDVDVTLTDAKGRVVSAGQLAGSMHHHINIGKRRENAAARRA